MSQAIVDVEEVSKSFGPTVALDRIRFQVAAGEVFGLLGPNGAGKTTLMSILACLAAADSGTARILDQVAHPDNRQVRRHIGLVPQDLALYGELTACENLAFFGRLYGLGGSELQERVAQVLEAVGLADRADGRVATFSGGMKRRLNLGAALVHRPQLLLLDEPTVGVDPQSRNHIFESVRRLNAAGVTIIYTSHYMEEVQALCTRIGIVDHGQLVACDTVPNLLRQLVGLVRLRLARVTPALRDRLQELPGVRLSQRDEHTLELDCPDIPATVAQLVALDELKQDLLRLETEEPNLERVFLHLTGRALRD
jgi:ABC-2 type transport system ATP-binding protein